MATSYTITSEVRQFAGFTGNTYVLDPTIDEMRSRAKARIDTIVGKRYLLPISDATAKEYLAQIELYLA